MYRWTTAVFVLAVTASWTGGRFQVVEATAALAKENQLEAQVSFFAWADRHGKDYTTETERDRRFQIWMENHARIEAHNEQDPRPTYTLGHNEFSDWTPDEFAQHFHLGAYARPYRGSSVETDGQQQQQRELFQAMEPLSLPDYVNWVLEGAVTPVKNQGACGSCWAFSTTGALEGAHFLKTGHLVSLSEQNLLDCDHLDLGCSGGLMDNAFKFDEKSGGLCSEKDYPYKAEQGPVCMNCTDVPGTIVKTFLDVPPGSEKALLAAIAMQPISIAIQADQFVFQFYKTGVITDDSCGSAGEIDHGVLAVGYGTDLETQQPYFLVKNSWGAGWGDHGYVKIGRKTKHQYGICAILKLASFPIVM